MNDTVTVNTQGTVAEIVIDRAPVNAIGAATYEALTIAFRELSQRTDVHAVILRSAGRHFSAGADLKESATSESEAESGPERRQRLARACYDAMLDCALPTIAAINGAALGAGAVLATCCDIRYAASDARIGLPEITAGRCGGGAHMMRVLPMGEVRRMYFTGDPLSAADAYRLGLVQHVSAPEELLNHVRTLARRIAAHSPLGLRLAKQALNAAEGLSVRQGYPAEQAFTLRLGAHPDAAEAARAVVEKRAPNWSWPSVREPLT